MSIVSVDDLVSRPIAVMNTIQEAVHVETRLEYSHVLRYAICFNDILIFIAMNFRSRPGAIIGDGDRKRAAFLVLGLAL